LGGYHARSDPGPPHPTALGSATKIDYKVTREGYFYIAGIILISLAALNTGNNLLFLILASLIAIILMSGILSSITLSGVAMRLPITAEHNFRRPAGSRLPRTAKTKN